jgi:hypothetical protein
MGTRSASGRSRCLPSMSKRRCRFRPEKPRGRRMSKRFPLNHAPVVVAYIAESRGRVALVWPYWSRSSRSFFVRWRRRHCE